MREKRDSSLRLARIINSLISTYQEVISHATAGDVRLVLGNCLLYRPRRPEDTCFQKVATQPAEKMFYNFVHNPRIHNYTI